ncbi:MAG: hypothetical protein ABWX73_12240 [Marmoricola sp.]
MDQVSADDTSTEVVRARRKRMRAHARGLRSATAPRSDEYQTPEWLDRSFVLPLTVPEVSDVPSQSVPHHDDYEAEVVEAATATPEVETAPAFVRPPTPEIDFARVIRRADLSRTATRTAMGSTGITGLVLIVYLLTSSPVVLGMAISFALVALVAIGVRIRTATAAIPYLDR